MDSVGHFHDAVPVQFLPALPLYWRVCLINGLVFLAGTIVLVVSPVTVSFEPTAGELALLGAGLLVILAMNALLLRHILVPLDRLRAAMRDADLLQPGQRVPVQGNPTLWPLITGFNRMLDRLEAERIASSSTAFAAQDAERERIARELHDDVGQQLTVVLLALKRVIGHAPENLAAELRAVQDGARTSLEDVRQVARRLRPDVLDDLGLASALRGLASDFSSNTGLPVLRRIDSRAAVLPRAAELAIYRVAQEALTNSARHARATSVALTLAAAGGTVSLVVSDDGVGLGEAPPSAGIRGMRERALLVGGRLTIAAPPGGGTAVRLDVPATQDQPARAA